MKCEEFKQNLEQESVSDSAIDHLKTCADCRGLQADFDAIRGLALELSAEEIAPPDRLWIALRGQLEEEGIIRKPAPAQPSVSGSWWMVFQKPAFAGGFLAVVLVAGIVGGIRGNLSPLQNADLAAQQDAVPAPGLNRTVKDDLLDAVNDTVSGFAHEDPALADSFRKNLDIVDKLIDVCEKSVREEPENQAARDYLNGAYEQKAELLATAMNHGAMGGLR